MIVGRAGLIALLMGKLKLDVLMKPTVFVQKCGGYASETVARHPAATVLSVDNSAPPR